MPEDQTASESRPPRPYWSQVLRALREAGGVTQDGWAAELGIGRTTLQRWENGQAVPDAEAEEAVVALCQRRGLFRRYESGQLQGITLTPEMLREVLTEARLGAQGPSAPPAEARVAAATTPAATQDPTGVTVAQTSRRLSASPLVIAGGVFVLVAATVAVTVFALTRGDDGDSDAVARAQSLQTIAAERPDGFISFTSEVSGKPAAYVVNFDGSDLVLALDSPLFDSEPRWSPDGRQIAFTSRSGGGRDIYLATQADGETLQLTDDPSDDLEPAWAPDGSLLAFTSGRDGSKDIFLMTPTGVVQGQITDDPADSFHPAWSPDGERIAFATTRDGNREIYVMNADGSGQTRLTDHPGDDDQPAWSPDGTQIAFQSRRDGNREIYVLNVDGSGLRRLTNDPEDDRQPVWSPDGGHLAFVSARDGGRQIYVVRSDGTGLRILSDAPGEKDQPNWVAPNQARP